MPAEEIRRLAEEIGREMRPIIELEVRGCVGEECKRIREQFENEEKTKEMEDAETERWNRVLSAVDKRFVSIEEKLDTIGKLPDEMGPEAEDCPNCGIKKGQKPKFVGHCSEEGRAVKFSDYEKALDWDHCPNCGSDIEWEDE